MSPVGGSNTLKELGLLDIDFDETKSFLDS